MTASLIRKETIERIKGDFAVAEVKLPIRLCQGHRQRALNVIDLATSYIENYIDTVYGF